MLRKLNNEIDGRMRSLHVIAFGMKFYLFAIKSNIHEITFYGQVVDLYGKPV